MYRLTLTKAERAAIDWVGFRYGHGTQLYRLLWTECGNEQPECDWDGDEDITFIVPESVAWEIRDIIEEDGLACCDRDLTEKLLDFHMHVV